MKLSHAQYEELHAFAFSSDNPGYKPDVIESPNGDGVWDEEKKYAHVAPKYGLDNQADLYDGACASGRLLCLNLNIPEQFYPGPDSTIRVLDYPPGATTAPHTDFCLFTLSLYRNDVDAFKFLSPTNGALMHANRLAPGVHFGELLTEITGDEATKHEVVATERRQLAAVFFVMPPLDAKLPSGLTVGQWLEERKSRSRK